MKQTNKLMGALLGAALMVGSLALPASSLAADKSRMVIQVSDNNAATWNLALNNVKNIQKDVGKDSVELEIVAFGPGINMLKADSEVANRIDEAIEAVTHAGGEAVEHREDLHAFGRDATQAKVNDVDALRLGIRNLDAGRADQGGGLLLDAVVFAAFDHVDLGSLIRDGLRVRTTL